MDSNIEEKIDLVLSKLSQIRQLLTLAESIPEEDELKAIKEYLEKKRQGRLDLVPLEEALNVN